MPRLILSVIQKLMEVYGTLSNTEEIKVEEFDLIEDLDLFEEEDAEAINALFELDDESFKVVFPSFIETLEDTLGKEEIKLLALQLAKKDNLTRAGVEELLETITEEVNNNENYSDIKKEGLILFFSTIFGQVIEMLSKEELIIIPLEKESKEIKTPVYMHESDAGMDIYAKEEITIKPGETVAISTGIKMAIPNGYAVLIHPRSGQSARTKLRIANAPGLLDSGYRGDVQILLENIEPPFKDIDYEFDDRGEIRIHSILHGQSYTISKGQRIAQLRLVKVPKIIFEEVDSVQLIGEDRGGGLGSTGV